MCGIPMEPKPDVVKGKKLTFEECLAHLGGVLITPEGERMIRDNAREFLWCYPGKVAYCTACGAEVRGVRGIHGERVACPACGRLVEFRHERKGHARIYDQFVAYEWRKSAIDPEVIGLVAVYCWRNSTVPRPENAKLNVHPTKLYIFRPGRAVTVYEAASHGGDVRERPWAVQDVAPAHTSWGMGGIEFVQSFGNFRAVIGGTRIGRVFDAIYAESNRRDELELTAVANCARKPWLEYLQKAGQGCLAAELMRRKHVSREIVPNQRARNPRALLGLTECQWHEARRDGVALTAERLEGLRLLERMGLKLHLREAVDIIDAAQNWRLRELAPTPKTGQGYHRETIGDMLEKIDISDKLRRRAYRRMLRETGQIHDWLDYYEQLRKLGEDMTDPALLLPKNMPEMHQRMIDRLRIIAEERHAQAEAERARERERLSAEFRAKSLPGLRRRFGFRAAGLVLRPYESAAEVVEEGRALHICIGSYVERYMRGGTVICCLRREEEPDEPWRAVELDPRSGMVIQDRGMRNDVRGGIEPGTKKQLRLFWAAYRRAGKEGRTA